MITPAKIREFASDPLAFAEHAFRDRGMSMADFQRERFAMMAPSLVALARGQHPPCGRFLLEGTKGCAKDGDIALVLIWLAAFATVPIDCEVGAGDQKQSIEMRKAARSWLHAMPWMESRIEIFTDKIVCDATKFSAAFVSTDASGTAHGSRCLLYVINELSHIAKDEFWLTMLDNAGKVPKGLVIVAQNAGFIDSPAYKFREMAISSPRWQSHIYDRPAPWIAEDELSEARRRNPGERFNRLWHGIWSHGQGNALPVDDVEAAITGIGPHPCRVVDAIVCGLDIGIKHDRSALVTLGSNASTGQVDLVQCRTWNPTDYADRRIPLQEVFEEVLRIHRIIGIDILCYDPSQAEFLAERLAGAGIRCCPWPSTPANLDRMAKDLIEGFRNRLICLYRDEQLIRDLFRLTLIERATGFRLDGKRDKSGHVDTATAFAIALPHALRWTEEIAEERSRPVFEEWLFA